MTVVLALLGAVAIGGCGGNSSDDATLTISQVFEPAKPFGVEGTATEVVVRFPNGGGAVVKPQPSKMELTQLFDTPVASGNYRVVARQRDCGATPCSEGGVPGKVVISCRRSLTAAGEDAALLIRVDPTGTGSCAIEDA